MPRRIVTAASILAGVLVAGCATSAEDPAQCYTLVYDGGRVHRVCKVGNTYDVRIIGGRDDPASAALIQQSLETVRRMD